MPSRGEVPSETANLSIGLARMGADLHVGQVYGEIQNGLLCLKQRDLHWEENLNHFNDPSFAGLFNDAMMAAGLHSAGQKRDLFDTKLENPDLQVGALVTGLNMKACTMSYSANGLIGKGDVSMDVEWQIYSVMESKIIARISTTASAKSGFGGMHEDFFSSLLNKAFAANATKLAADPALVAIVQRPARSTAPSVPPPAPVGDLFIALPSAAKPIQFNAASQSVVSIFTADALGSGFLISAEGYILTNHHVAGDVGRVRIHWSDGSDTVGEVVRANRKRDVALVKTTPPKGVAPLAIRYTPVQLGETIYAIGTPREKEFFGTLTRGIVSTVRRVIDGQGYIQSDVAVTHGNSGGPLLDEKGWIVGIAQSVYEPDGIGQNINFFIPIEEALKALALKPAG